MSRYTVNRCICQGNSFEEIKAYVKENNIQDLKVLQERKICSCSCKMCIPYIEKMLETGQTEFEPGEPYAKRRTN